MPEPRFDEPESSDSAPTPTSHTLFVDLRDPVAFAMIARDNFSRYDRDQSQGITPDELSLASSDPQLSEEARQVAAILNNGFEIFAGMSEDGEQNILAKDDLATFARATSRDFVEPIVPSEDLLKNGGLASAVAVAGVVLSYQAYRDSAYRKAFKEAGFLIKD